MDGVGEGEAGEVAGHVHCHQGGALEVDREGVGESGGLSPLVEHVELDALVGPVAAEVDALGGVGVVVDVAGFLDVVDPAA